MNKKTIIIIVAIFIVIAIAIGGLLFLNLGLKNTINIDEANTQISASEDFSQMAMMDIDKEVLNTLRNY